MIDIEDLIEILNRNEHTLAEARDILAEMKRTARITALGGAIFVGSLVIAALNVWLILR